MAENQRGKRQKWKIENKLSFIQKKLAFDISTIKQKISFCCQSFCNTRLLFTEGSHYVKG